jgi:hypothetical protein
LGSRRKTSWTCSARPAKPFHISDADDPTGSLTGTPPADAISIRVSGWAVLDAEPPSRRSISGIGAGRGFGGSMTDTAANPQGSIRSERRSRHR